MDNYVDSQVSGFTGTSDSQLKFIAGLTAGIHLVANVDNVENIQNVRIRVGTILCVRIREGTILCVRIRVGIILCQDKGRYHPLS